MIHIGPLSVGPNQPCFIIAEACDNHLGDLDDALEMVRLARLAGASAIKFQHHIPDEEMLQSVPKSSNFDTDLYTFLKQHALTLDQHSQLKSYCESIGIQYLCTPFSLRAAMELNALGVEAFKIGSGELCDLPTLSRICRFGKPMIVSTGMATFEEIDQTYQLITSAGVPLVLMNCTSEYPPRYEDINLGVIQKMKTRYPTAEVGHSDHTPDLFTSWAAVALGASVIEKHVILDKRQPGPDQSVSVDFLELATLVEGIRKIESALGSEKKVHPREEQIREWAHRSVVSLRDIGKGVVISEDDVWTKRPGTGIPASRLNEVIGRTTMREIKAGSLVRWEDLSP